MVLSWWLVAILGLAIFFAVFKSQDLIGIIGIIKKNLFLVILIAVLLFLSFSFYQIYTIYDIDLTNFEGMKHAGKLYFQWFISIFDNLGKITGYAINQDWVLNSTNITK